jgi:hypothetical protein
MSTASGHQSRFLCPPVKGHLPASVFASMFLLSLERREKGFWGDWIGSKLRWIKDQV